MTKAAFQPASFTNAFARTADKKIRTHCGILSSRRDHTKGTRHRKRGGDAPDGERACCSVGQHPVSSMPSSLWLHTSALFAVSAILSQTLVSNAGSFVDFKITLPIQLRTFSLASRWIHDRVSRHEKQKCRDFDKAAVSRN
jgi:hypothetical protein